MSMPWFTSKGQIIQVLSAVVATAALLSGAAKSLLKNEPLAMGPIILYVLVGAVVLGSIVPLFRRGARTRSQLEPMSKLELMDVSIRYQQGATYPLKAFVQMRNDGPGCADVQSSGYVPGGITHKKFVPAVLQLKLLNEWCPTKEGTDRLAVLPGQYFQGWIGLDDTRFSKEAADRLIGQIGRFVLKVNGQTVQIPL